MMEQQELKKHIWTEAATGGLYLGLAMSASMVIRYLLKDNSMATWFPGLLDFGILVGFIYAYARRVGKLYGEGVEYSYPQSLGFILRMMLFSGVIAGLGQFVMSAYVDPEYYQMLTEQTLLQLGYGQEQVNQSMDVIRLMKTPMLLVVSGVFTMLIYGGLIGLVVSAFVRRRMVPVRHTPDEVLREDPIGPSSTTPDTEDAPHSNTPKDDNR